MKVGGLQDPWYILDYIGFISFIPPSFNPPFEPVDPRRVSRSNALASAADFRSHQRKRQGKTSAVWYHELSNLN